MANANTLGMRVQQGTEAALAVIEAHGTEERKQRIRNGFHGSIPMPNRNPFAYAALTAEIMGGLSEIIETMATAQAAANAPKKRGRPRKDGEPVETSQHAAMDAVEEAVATD